MVAVSVEVASVEAKIMVAVMRVKVVEIASGDADGAIVVVFFRW